MGARRNLKHRATNAAGGSGWRAVVDMMNKALTITMVIYIVARVVPTPTH